LKISDPEAEAVNGTVPTLCTVTCNLANVQNEDGATIWADDGRCYGPETPQCLCDYYKWQVLQQFDAMDADYLMQEVDKETVPQNYAKGCDYGHAKHQCHAEFGVVENKAVSTDRKVGVNGVCVCQGTCPE
jgi:hypothetical protein